MLIELKNTALILYKCNKRNPSDLNPATVLSNYRPILERENKTPEHPGQNDEDQRGPESYSSLSERDGHYVPAHLHDE